MSVRRKLQWIVSVHTINIQTWTRGRIFSPFGGITGPWDWDIGFLTYPLYINDINSYRNWFISPSVSSAPNTFIFQHKVLTFYIKAFSLILILLVLLCSTENRVCLHRVYFLRRVWSIFLLAKSNVVISANIQIL